MGEERRIGIYDRTLAYLSKNDLSPSEEEMPAELALLVELEDLNVLPFAGGYFDQPFTLISDLRAVRAARFKKNKYREQTNRLQSQIDDIGKSILAGGVPSTVVQL